MSRSRPGTATSLAHRIADALADDLFAQPLTDPQRRLLGSPLARPYKVREAEIAAASECPLKQFEQLSGRRLQ